MKRRIVKKTNRYKVFPPRLINKAMYIAFRLQEYWSLGINSKKYYTVYVMDNGEEYSCTLAQTIKDE